LDRPRDDEPKVRRLLRLLTATLGLALAVAGGGGLSLQLGGEEGLRALEQRLIERADALAQTRGLDAAQRSAYARKARELGAFAAKLAQPPAYGGLIGAGVMLLSFSLFALRSRATAPKPKREPTRAARSGRTAAKAPEPARAATTPPEEPQVERTVRDRKKILKTAAQLEKDQGAEAAGDHLLDAGLRDEAVEVFVRGELLVRAGEVRHDQNRFEDAAELFSKAGRWETAGKIYAQVEAFDKAARCYMELDKKSVAGEMFERAGSYREAGDCYRAIGFGRHAAQAYLKAHAESEAAECLVAVFNEEGGVAAAKSDVQVKEMRGIAKTAGDLLFKLERYEEAEAVLSRGELYGPAAKVAFHRNDFARAADLFLKVSRGDLAAKALERLGNTKGAARALGNYLREQGQLEQAAEQLESAEEWVDAAGAYRSMERYADAGRCYFNGQDFGAAAEMFRAVGEYAQAGESYAQTRQFREAAQSFQEANLPVRQAEMLEQAGENFEAGTLFMQHGRHEDAIRLLQQVPDTDVRFADACAALGQVFAERGMDSLAVKKYEQATADTAVSRATVQAYYGLARAYEQRGQLPRAIELFERILTFDYQYEDVAARVEQIKATSREVARTASPAVSPVLADDGATQERQERYQAVREIGRGGMGVVYLARDRLLERDVAYKVLPEQLRENPDALRNFLREAKAAAQLNHPNIVTVYDVGESSHGYYLAMEFVNGTTLKEIVQKRGPIAPGGLIYILRQMAEALGYAHGKKVVHRDIKTANTMWTADKQVKIMDFGLAKLMEEVRNATTTISGTPFYMSPEQTLGKSVDHRTDLYSLGVTVFELATGQLPFRRGNVPYHHVHTPPPDPRTLNPKLPDPLAEVILRCLAKAPDDRYASAREVVEDLARRMKALETPIEG
jgi:eukaryotic-like serine/threonine-protein kinase